MGKEIIETAVSVRAALQSSNGVRYIALGEKYDSNFVLLLALSRRCFFLRAREHGIVGDIDINCVLVCQM